MTKKEVQRVLKAIDRWTRAEIMSRYSDRPDWRDYGPIKIKYEDRIRKIIYGTKDMIEIGQNLGILSKPKRRKKRAHKIR